MIYSFDKKKNLFIGANLGFLNIFEAEINDERKRKSLVTKGCIKVENLPKALFSSCYHLSKSFTLNNGIQNK
jgi:hypothetical protein